MGDAGDVRLQLNDLEAEEARIMRELRELDEKAHAQNEASRRLAEQYKDNPEAALTSLLLECEKEVRDAKGYIADQGPPLRIVRLRHGETGPKSATYLSRPRNTGVDFTVPVTLKAYTDLIKSPIFLNQIRDKIKQHKYSSTQEYLEDMRLLVRNTSQFNKGPDLAWVVQHARFLLEAAEDAVTSRRLLFREVEESLRQQTTQKLTRQNTPALSAVGKRKRSHTQDKTNGDLSAVPAVGSAIEIYWPSYRKWYLAYITAHGEGGTCHLRYDEDNSLQWVTLDHERWRMRNSRFTGAARGKRAHEQQPAKRRKAGAAASSTTDQPAYVSGGITPEDLDAIKIDLFAKFDDLRDSIMEQLKDHLGRIDRAIIRSDALSRILIQVEDTQGKVEVAMEGMEKRFDSLEKKVNESLKTSAPNQVGTGQSPNLEEQGDIGKEEGPDAADHPEKESLEDIDRESKLGSVQNHAEREAALAGPTERDKNEERPLENEIAMADVDRDTEEGIKISHSDDMKKTVHEKDPSSVTQDKLNLGDEQNNDKLVIKKSTEEGTGINVDLGRGEEAETSKGDPEMTDVGIVDERKRTDTINLPNEDKLETTGAVRSDSKAHAVRGNRHLQEDSIDLEAGSPLETAEQQKEESSDSDQSDDSESDDGGGHKGIAEKKPATRPVPDVESKGQIRPRISEDEKRELSDGAPPVDETAEAEANDSMDKEVVVEQEKVGAEVSMEKPSEEIETVAISATGGEAREHEKEQSSSSREQKVLDRDVGD